MRFLLMVSILILASLQIFAQLDGNPENFCRNGFFPRESESFGIGTVKGKKGEKIYFYGDGKDCPNGKNCRLKSYVIPNDEVIVSRNYGNFTCVWFQPKKGSETVGWIRTNQLEITATIRSINEFVGNWSYYDNEIEITQTDKSGNFKVTGNAFWKGLGDNVHIGELDGEAKFIENSLKYGANDIDEYACKVTMHLAGKYLIVSDNLNCGGANVTFTGVYRRSSKK